MKAQVSRFSRAELEAGSWAYVWLEMSIKVATGEFEGQARLSRRVWRLFVPG